MIVTFITGILSILMGLLAEIMARTYYAANRREPFSIREDGGFQLYARVQVETAQPRRIVLALDYFHITNLAETYDHTGRQAGEISLSPSMQEFAEQAARLPTEEVIVNMGPSHPAMHGTVRIVLRIDGELIKDADVQIGYLHRGFEKECEAGTWYQVIPYTDRLNYASSLLANVGYCMAVEKLLPWSLRS